MEKTEIEFIKNQIKQIREQYKTEYTKLLENFELCDKWKLTDEKEKKRIHSLNAIQEDLDVRFKFNGFGNDFDESNFFDNYNKQVGIVFKNIKTKEFYNKFFDYSVVYPKRESTANLSYILYYLYQLEDYEIYILNNILRGQKNQRRVQENIAFSNVIYIDIDHIKGSDDLDINDEDYAEQLNDLLYAHYDFLDMFEDLEFNANASGTGLHLYFKIKTLYMNKKNTERYLKIASNLTRIFNGDMNCVDTARILRPCQSYNKKEKFVNPKLVECVGLGKDCKAYYLEELEQMIEKYDRNERKKQKDIPSGFYEIECDEVVFTDEPIPITTSTTTKIKNKTEAIIKEANTTTGKRKQKDTYFKLTDYKINENFPNQYLIQDLLFFIQNRNGYCKGYRRNLLFIFYFCFRQYCLMSAYQTRKYIYKINNLFQEPLKQKEVEEYLKYLSNYDLCTGITNNKVCQILKFEEEEITFMRGSYNVSQEERKKIKLDRDRRVKREQYQHKKPTHTEIEICMKNNQSKTNQEIADLLGISVRTIQRVKKKL